MLALQEASEAYLINLFEWSNLAAIAAAAAAAAAAADDDDDDEEEAVWE